MKSIEHEFSELIGQILGRQWFEMQQAKKDAENGTRLHLLAHGDSDKYRTPVKRDLPEFVMRR